MHHCGRQDVPPLPAGGGGAHAHPPIQASAPTVEPDATSMRHWFGPTHSTSAVDVTPAGRGTSVHPEPSQVAEVAAVSKRFLPTARQSSTAKHETELAPRPKIE